MAKSKKSANKQSQSQKPRKREILLVDDHPLFRRGMGALLDSQDDLGSVRQAEADFRRTTLDTIRRRKFDLAIVDIGLGGSANGIELVKSITAEQPELPVLMVSMHDEMLYAERALRAGARGYVMKREALDCVLGAIRDVLRGEISIGPGDVEANDF
mgnify:CR=1 FL=1